MYSCPDHLACDFYGAEIREKLIFAVMVSVNEAKNIIQVNTLLLSPLAIALNSANGLVLAEDVYAKVSVPNFDQSAMDGYAFRFEDYLQNNELIIQGEVAAGDNPNESLA